MNHFLLRQRKRKFMRTTRRQQILVGALASLLTFSTSCSSSDPSDASAPGPDALDGRPVTITFWHGLSGASGTALRQAVGQFNKTNPDHITVKAVYQGTYEETLAKYTTAVRKANTPDVLLAGDMSTGFLQDSGQTVPAQDLADANPGDLYLNDIRDIALSYYSLDGKLRSVPFNTSLPMLFVNDKILDQAGVDKSTLTTVGGLAAGARQVHSKLPDIYGFTNPQSGGWWFEQLTAAAGSTYCGPGNGRTGQKVTTLTLSGSAQRAALEQVTSLYTDGVAFNPGTNADAAISAFTSGKVAMMLSSSGAIGDIAAATKIKYTALPLPLAARKGVGGPLIGGASLWVSGPGHDAAHQLASWKLISYLVSPETQEQFSHASGFAPVNVDVDYSLSQEKYLTKNPDQAAVMDQFMKAPVNTATAGCLTGALPKIREKVLSAMTEAFHGEISLDAAINRAEDESAGVIETYNSQADR
ncbi:ABC transporter substrate-binding protein [Streptomyces chartreusis]|uniref:ABC transporter substrate-binding protein n=1 Tax=Streptomyces chartreusis TaxID=1969 RepID=UPI00365C48CF